MCASLIRRLLFSLFFSVTWGVEEPALNQFTLVPAINFLRRNYQPGSNTQYAIAFNAPVDKCADYLDNNFLSIYPAQKIKNALKSDAKLYTGAKLIAACPKPIPDTKNNQHSEYLLLNVPSVNQSPMSALLNEDNTGCVVFYTYNSPCTKTCVNPNNCFNILDALNMFEIHNGPKAFVFTQVWQHDCANTISTNLKEVLERVPLYRCDQNNCVACDNVNNCIRNSEEL